MYLWDSNILRHFAEGHPTLKTHLQKIPWTEIALPSVVVAEVLRGRCDYALKATSEQAPLAHRLLIETQQLFQQFQVIVFDDACAKAMQQLQRKSKTHKRYADVMVAATAIAGNHTVVTRNQIHFVDLLPPNQLANWIDEPSV
jgi:tRNA(fMet)-specific endonuclease VapC